MSTIKGDGSLLKREAFSGHPRLGDWIVKLQDTAINEVAAYQMASLAGVPVAGFRAFVLKAPLDYRGHQLRKGDVGMLIEYLSPTGGESVVSLAQQDPQQAMRILAFWAFDRHEWGEIWRMGPRLAVIDLEFQFARYITGRPNRNCRLQDYRDGTMTALRYTLKALRRGQVAEIAVIRFQS